MSKTYEVTLAVKPRITVEDVDKLVEVVCDNSTGWCEVFNTYNDIEDWVDCFSYQFWNTPSEFKKDNEDKNDHSYSYVKFVEGYGTLKEIYNGEWELQGEKSVEEFGNIFVKVDDNLEVDWSASEV